MKESKQPELKWDALIPGKLYREVKPYNFPGDEEKTFFYIDGCVRALIGEKVVCLPTRYYSAHCGWTVVFYRELTEDNDLAEV
jgi:hypothetical protein